MAKKQHKASKIVRRYDKNGRKYFIDKTTGKRTTAQKWVNFQLKKKEKAAEAADRGKTKKGFFIQATVSHRNFIDTVQTLIIEQGYKAEITDENGQKNIFKPGDSVGFGLLLKSLWKKFEKLLKNVKDKVSPDILYTYKDYIKIKLITADLRQARYNY